MTSGNESLSLWASIAFLAFVVLLLRIVPAYAVTNAEFDTLERGDLVIRFNRPLSGVANEIARFFPKAKTELSTLLGWELVSISEVVLVRDHEAFRMVAGSDMVVAFADPRKGRIVVDCSRIGMPHFDLEMVFKHELCHLFLHFHIPSGLPRWLDEGIAQWTSGGLGEILVENRTSILDEAVLSGRVFRFDDLTFSFPEDRYGVALAYEQSKSFVEYMAATYGTPELVALLNLLKDGTAIDEAVHNTMGLPLAHIERNWLSHFGTRTAWLAYVSNNLYEILFLLAALLTVIGAVKIVTARLIARRRREEDDE